MLTKIKSVLSGMTPALPAASSAPVSTPNVVKAQVDLKQKQLRRGTTKAEVERFTADLAAASLALGHAEIAEGECLVDGHDATAATEARRQTSDRVRVLEAALTVAIQKDNAAQAQLKDAERQVVIDAEAVARSRVLALGPRFEEVSALVRQLAVDTARETEALSVVGGREKYAYGATEIRMQFDLFFGLSKHPLTNNGHVPEAFMKYKTFTACLEAICGHPRS